MGAHLAFPLIAWKRLRLTAECHVCCGLFIFGCYYVGVGSFYPVLLSVFIMKALNFARCFSRISRDDHVASLHFVAVA